MKKLLLIVSVLVAVAVVATGCKSKAQEEKENTEAMLKQFATMVARNAINGNTDSVHTLYPLSAECDSFGCAGFVPDSVVVTPVDSSTYILNLTPNIQLTVAMVGPAVSVVDSRGLFLFSESDIEKGRMTGQYVDNLTDIELLKRMKDKGFEEYMASKAKKASSPLKLAGVSVGHEPEWGGDQGWYNATVVNNTDQDVAASDYCIDYKRSDSNVSPASYRDSEKGVAIPPHGSVTIRIPDGMHCWYEGGAHVVVLNKDLGAYKYTGREYDEYLESKN